MDRRTVKRLLLAPLVLPHEIGHALPAWAAGLDAEITVLPDWSGAATPLGQFDADLDPTTPTWLVRVIAVTPLLLYLSVAAALGTVVSASSPLALLLFPVLTFWAALSGGDIAIAADPDAARAAGAFLVTGSRWQTQLADVLTVATAVVVALLLLR